MTLTKIEIRTGSDSDIPKIKDIYTILTELNIPFTKRIISAHRTPNVMIKEAKKLKENGYFVSVSAAGGSAHLAGMTASDTVIPVVALPVKSSLGGEDALLSMAQMPPGIPNGCVGINDARNAGILATRIAYLNDKTIRQKLEQKLRTRIIAELGQEPIVNIVTDSPSFDTSLLEKLGIIYTINEQITSPIVIYSAEISKFPEIVPSDIEQISILAPTKNKSFRLLQLPDIIQGPYAWIGVERVNNASLYAAQILGNYFPEVQMKFQQYRNDLAEQVKEKDKKLQEK